MVVLRVGTALATTLICCGFVTVLCTTTSSLQHVRNKLYSKSGKKNQKPTTYRLYTTPWHVAQLVVRLSVVQEVRNK